MSIANEFSAYLRENGHDPRSSRHSDFLSWLIIRDLVKACPLIARRAASGELVGRLRHHQQVGHDDWVIDIAIGTCAGTPVPPVGGAIITNAPPVIIQIAIELKGIITEHGKARRNRLRDFLAFHGHAHTYDPRTVATAFLVVNSAECFYSPLNFGKANRSEITLHGNTKATARQVAKDCVDLFRGIHLRHSERDGPGLEGLGIIVIEHDNIAIHPQPEKYAELSRPSQVAPTPPSLAAGDPLHYESMIQRTCSHYTQRFR
jgi:hypothetical protein